MGSLTANDIVQVWEAGYRQDSAERAITMMSVVYPGENADTLRRFSLGRRNLLLLELHERLFGRDLSGFAECPQCRERLEFTVNCAQLRADAGGDSVDVFELETSGYALRFRLLDTHDINAARAAGAIETGRRLLIDRCLIDARCDGVSVSSEDLPESVIEQLGERLAACDAHAEILTALSCPACEFHWEIPLDIASFCYLEISAMAQRLLREVHLLARAYAWSESDILAMSARRREFYLEMLDQ